MSYSECNFAYCKCNFIQIARESMRLFKGAVRRDAHVHYDTLRSYKT